MADSLLGRAGLLLDDCIAAVSTPRGRGAVGIVRISGSHERVATVLGSLVAFSGSLDELPTRRMTLVTVRDEAGEPLDRALLAWFRGPQSYTGEDVAELHLHGNPVLLESALEACVAAGARLAEPGEFTRRALAHGKLSLTEAEGVDALIRAPGLEAARAAQRHLNGELDERLASWIARLLGAAVALEALVDFPDEVDEEDVRAEVESLPGLEAELGALLATVRSGRRLLEGVRVALSGPVNAGKSTLLNALLGHERAIVSPVAGTTRDVVSEAVEWRGVLYRLEDTAGLRETTDPIEQAGIERSARAGELADVRVAVRDGRLVDGESRREAVGVATHADLCSPARLEQLSADGWICVDGRAAVGTEAVRAAIIAAADLGDATGQLVLHTARQQQQMRAACDATAEAASLGLAEPVLAAVAVRRAGRALEELAGRWVDERVLDELFERFCIGK